MALIDDIAEIIRNTPINKMDLAFAERLNPMKAYEGIEQKPDYKVLIETMLRLFDESVSRGVPRERATAVILGTHEEIVRYVITQAVKERLRFINPQALDMANVEGLHKDLLDKIEIANQEMKKLGEAYRAKAANQSVDQFKAYLLYAADEFAKSDEEKQVLRTVAGRILVKGKRTKKNETVK